MPSSNTASRQPETPAELRYPLSPETILRKRVALKKQLLQSTNLLSVRIAILGGAATQEVRSILDLFLLAQGIQGEFYESDYNAYHEEVTFRNPALWEFKPDVVFVHTTWHNIREFPQLLSAETEAESVAQRELDRFRAFWESIRTDLNAVVIQNNFDLPALRPLGNPDGSEAFGRANFILRLNSEFARYARSQSRFIVNDIMYLSARVGLERWSDPRYWYHYHMLSPAATVQIAKNVATIVGSLYGRTKKCLVLDLDNTLWGGVIGDDGVNGIILGRDHPVGEAFADFQHYVKALKERGILLAVCSKNDEENAKQGFSHPDSILKLADFSSFKANWEPKSENIRQIAAELNIGLDSLVFVDDNPVERSLVAAQVPEVAVPDVGSDVSEFARVLDAEGFFAPVKILSEDIERASYYGGNVERSAAASTFSTYDDFLESLDMEAEISSFQPVYFERITQLINKSNQFNLTTRRYSSAEVETVAGDPDHITVYGRLRDRFGDNGLVSVVIASVDGDIARVDLWLMSCRVLKRGMENAMFDELIAQCAARGVRSVIGVYIPSAKNGMVADHYGKLGFDRVGDGADAQALWQYEIPSDFTPTCKHIRTNSLSHATAATH